MTTDAAVSTPGKLILMGEHAAVYGHPALVAAVDLRMRVTLRGRSDRMVLFELPQLGAYGETDWPAILSLTRSTREEWTRWSEDPARSPWDRSAQTGPERLVKLALGEAATCLGLDSGPGLLVRVDSHLPPGAGLGSSASLAVGVAAAFMQVLGVRPTEEALSEVALEVERRQHGTPSGVDSTSVLRGGVLWVSRDGRGELFIERIPARPGLLKRLQIFQSGTPVEPTGAVVADVRRRMASDPGRLTGALSSIREATEALRRELLLEERSEDPARLREILQQGEAALEELGVVPEATRRVIRRVEEAGGAAKISGAGALTGEGAGAVIVYHPEPEKVDRWAFLAPWTPFRVKLGAEGLRPEALL